MKKYILIIAAALSFASCKGYLDINYDPNTASPAMVSNDEILPAAEMALCSQYGNMYRIFGAYFAEHYTQFFGTSNYLDFSKFTMSQTRSSSSYSVLTQGCIGNATVVRDNAAAADDWGTYLAAVTLRVFAFQALADAYGEIPYTEAMNPDEYPNPKYDEGQVIYDGLIAELDEALGKVKAGDAVATNFLYSGQSASNWIKFANALKLKILMRESGKKDVASQVKAIIDAGNLPDGDVAWQGFWQNSSGKANPFYQEEFALYFGSTQINCGLNVALYRTMSAYNDARLQKFFSPNADNAYWGSISGDNMSTSGNYKSGSFCRPNMAFDSPVYLITKAEIEFFIAEYYKNAGNAAQAKAHYEAAINASFQSVGADGSAAAIAAWPYDGTDKCIGVQKWVALSGTNNFEAWCELRRLGYPAFGGKSASDIYKRSDDTFDATVLNPGDLYTPYQVDPDISSNALLQRWPYALVSTQSNSNHLEVKKNSVKVFWAK